MFNKYPYTDFHELNTDWIISKIKNVETAEANTQEYMETAVQAKDDAVQAKDDAVQAKDDAVIAQGAAEDARDAAADSAQDAADVVSDTLNQINLLQSRVDNIIPNGTQTAGNTELLDIRVGYNGETYASAGDAVRDQASDLHDALKSNDYSNVITFEQGYWKPADGSATSSTNWCRSHFIDKDYTVVIGNQYRLYLFAFNRISGSYVGFWNGSAFGTTWDVNAGVKSLKISDWLSSYPDYIFKVGVYSGTSSVNITPSDVYNELLIYDRTDDIALKVSYQDAAKNLVPYNTSYKVGYLAGSTGVSREDIYRGIFTDFIKRSDYNSIKVSGGNSATICLFDSTYTYTGVWYNSTSVPTTCDYIRIFIYPSHTGGNSSATKAEMDSIKKSFVVYSNTKLISVSGEPNIIVAADGSGAYTTISAAVSAASDGDTIYIKDGQYKETVIVNKYLHLVGESKMGTILYNDIGDYDHAPLSITQGSVCNMTIKSLAPADTSALSDYAYAIHLDKNFASNPDYQNCEIFNCNIYSEVNDAIGAGTNYASEYDIHDCFIHVAHQPVKTGSCAFKCHNGQNQTTGKVTLKNNTFMTEDANGSTTYDILYHNGGISNVQPLDIVQIGNVLKYYSNTVPAIFIPNSYNYGNSVAAMNVL